jgi:hypothetical protein
MLFADLFDELGAKSLGAVIGLVVGGLITWFVGHWRRRRLRHMVLRGDARDTVVIHHHLIDTAAAPEAPHGRRPTVMRVRALGQEELGRVVPNGHLAAVLLDRAFAVTPQDTLISMEGAEGSFLLETLTGFVCDRVANAPFDHDLYVMAPCCEPKELAEHQPISILLIAMRDLVLFEDWPSCRKIQVEHGSDGARVLTLMNLARRFKTEQAAMAQLRQAGQRTKYVETMYILDLALDRRAVPVETKEVPWGRFEPVLTKLNLE